MGKSGLIQWGILHFRGCVNLLAYETPDFSGAENRTNPFAIIRELKIMINATFLNIVNKFVDILRNFLISKNLFF